MSRTPALIAAPTITLLLFAGCAPEKPPASTQTKPAAATAPALAPAAPAPSSAPPTSSKAAEPAEDPALAELIASVESAYRQGRDRYHAGNLQAAKIDFDHAVDLMLTSKFDIQSTPQLSDEFEHILDAVNTLEMEALKQGNGFSPKIEPAPVDVANDVTFPVDPNIKARAIAELKTTQSDLPLVINDPVASYINYFSSRGRGTLMRSLERAGRYRDMISRILAEEAVPQDLIYQAVAESGFQPQAVNSRSGAGGMWQFMPSGPYGLTRNSWFDERFDPEKSTRAYAVYMKSLYAELGDWYLAMAAYDWGAGNVQRAVQRTGYADFWELYRRNVLPQETKNYVPIIIAAALMAKNPQQYGLQSLVPDPALVTDTVETDYSVNLLLVADIVQAPVQEIIALNPSLLRMSTPVDGPFDLHLPAGSSELYQTRIAEIPPAKRNIWRLHVVAPGETLASIAHDYHVSESEIASVNRMEPTDTLSGSESLVIPVPPSRSAGGSGRLTRYRVERGDTLVTVADRFDVTVRQLRRWNHLTSNHLTPGRRLYVAEPGLIRRPARSSRHRRSGTKQTAAAHRKSPTGAVTAKTPAGGHADSASLGND